MLLTFSLIALVFGTLWLCYQSASALGEADPRTLFFCVYGFFLLILSVMAAIVFAVSHFDIYDNGEPITKLGNVLNKALFFEVDIKQEFILALGLLVAVLVPQILADIVTGIIGVSPGKVRLAFLIRVVLSLFAKSLISFSAVGIGVLLYSVICNVDAQYY